MTSASRPAATPTSPIAPRAPRRRPAWLGLLAGAAIGGAGALVGARLLGPGLGASGEVKQALRAAWGPWFTPLLLVVLAAVATLAIAAHELGHVLGGALARFRFQLFVVGPLRVEREGRTGRVRVGLNRSLALAGGIAGALPTGEHDLPRRMALMVAGGPLASALLGVAAGAAGATGAVQAPLARLATGAFALVSLGLAAVTLLPMRSGGFATDGARLLRLARRGPEARREAATLALLARSTGGVRPRDWPAPLVAQAGEPADATLEECYGRLLAYYHHLDAARPAEASAAMGRVTALRDAFPAPYRGTLDAEAAYWRAAVCGDAPGARALLAGIPARAAGLPAYERARAEAAVLRAEGDAASARRVAAAALPEVPETAPFTRARLEELVGGES